MKREIKSSFQESQTILNGLLTVLPQNIQGDTILFEPFEILFYLIEYVFLVMIAKSQIDSQTYLIYVGIDCLLPIDGVLKDKLNYEFQIQLFFV